MYKHCGYHFRARFDSIALTLAFKCAFNFKRPTTIAYYTIYSIHPAMYNINFISSYFSVFKLMIGFPSQPIQLALAYVCNNSNHKHLIIDRLETSVHVRICLTAHFI